MLGRHHDVAVISLDAAMESDEASLSLNRHVRDEIGNRLVRIILRTGVLDPHDEKSYVTNYDINGFANKSELTSDRSSSMLIASLRADRDLEAVSPGKLGLEQIIRTGTRLFERQTLTQFKSNVLAQLASVLCHETSCRT